MKIKEKLEVVKALQRCGIRQYRLALEEVEKDLEILEILKKHLNYSEAKNLDTSIISKENYNITIFKALYGEDFNKIKQWVESDKNG